MGLLDILQGMTAMGQAQMPQFPGQQYQQYPQQQYPQQQYPQQQYPQQQYPQQGQQAIDPQQAYQQGYQQGYQAGFQAALQQVQQQQPQVQQPQQQPQSQQPQAAVEPVQLGFNGAIDAVNWQGGAEAQVMVSRMPDTLQEFQQLMLSAGQYPQSTVLLQLLAFEMYRKDSAVGEQCLRLVNSDTNLSATMSRLRELLLSNDINYARPYQVASFFRGARPDNGYRPDKPYVIAVRVDPVKPYEQSQLLGGLVLNLQVYSEGFDTPWRDVQLVKPNGSYHYVVTNCPALYTQCKPMVYGLQFVGL